MNAAMRAEAPELAGIGGLKVITGFEGGFWSPLYGHHTWQRGAPIQWATCPVGCERVPGDRHPGCGYHACLGMYRMAKFLRDIRGPLHILRDIRGALHTVVLVDGLGTVKVGEIGYRAQAARIAAVVAVDTVRLAELSELGMWAAAPDPSIAAKYFEVPVVTAEVAAGAIQASLERYGFEYAVSWPAAEDSAWAGLEEVRVARAAEVQPGPVR